MAVSYVGLASQSLLYTVVCLFKYGFIKNNTTKNYMLSGVFPMIVQALRLRVIIDNGIHDLQLPRTLFEAVNVSFFFIFLSDMICDLWTLIGDRVI